MGSWSAGYTEVAAESSDGDEPDGAESSSSTSGSSSSASGPASSTSSTTTSTTANSTTSTTTSDDTAASSDPEGSSSTGSTGPGDEETGVPSSVCDGIGEEALVPPVNCDGPNGNTTTEIPPNDLYSTSWFGCYFNEDGSIHEDPFDNCEFACGNQGLCPAGQDGPNCEANLQWFAADADRYGCGGRIRVTNCDNGNSVVLVTLDRGPNCNSVEGSCDAPVLDMSHDAMVYLFDGGTYGGCDHQNVVVEEVGAETPLGPE